MAGKLGFYTTAEGALRGADLSGKTAVVTGGNSGLGAETVRVLAMAGADVILCSRSVEAGQKVADEIAASLATAANAAAAKSVAAQPTAAVPGHITVVPLDLNDLRSVEAFAAHTAVARLPAIHLLVLNAGIMGLPKLQRTKQGFEAQWGVCHVAHQHLTQLLLPKMKAQGAPARVVALSSFGHNFAKELPMDDLNWERRKYGAWPAYGQAKLSNALFACELARRMEEEGVPIKAYSVHPGFINTSLSRHMSGGGFVRRIWQAIATSETLIGWMGGKTVPQGAATTVFACVAPELETHNGEYLADCQVGSEVPGMWGRRSCHPSKLATDGQLARQLWERTEQMIAQAMGQQDATKH